MRKKLLYIFPILTIAILIGGCRKETMMKYENDPRVYLLRGIDIELTPAYTQTDSVNFTFVTVPHTEDSYDLVIDVRIMGFPASYDREISFVQTNVGDEDAAVAGKHYVAFDDPEQIKKIIMPAGAVRALVPVTLLRDPSLEDSKLYIKFKLIENKHFKLGYEKNLKYRISTTSQFELPKAWAKAWVYYLGNWGHKKMWFLTQILGLHPSLFDDSAATGLMESIQSKCIVELRKYNNDPSNSDTPLMEADGTTPVTFPGM